EGDREYWLSNFTDNNLEWFKQYHVRFSTGHHRFLTKRSEQLPAEITELEVQIKKTKPNQVQSLKKKLNQKREQLSKYKEELAKYNPENFAKLSSFEQQLHQRAFTTNINDSNYYNIEEVSYIDGGEEKKMQVPKGDIL